MNKKTNADSCLRIRFGTARIKHKIISFRIRIITNRNFLIISKRNTILMHKK